MSKASKALPFWRSGASTPFLLLAPALITMAFVVLVPLVFSLYTSFTGYRLVRPETLYTVIGWRNYARALTDFDFWIAFGRTILFLTIAINLELLLGLGIALLINKVTWGQRTLRTIMMFPVRSLCYLLGKFQNIQSTSRVKITFISPKHLAIKTDIKTYLRKHGIDFEEQDNLNKYLPLADIVYMTRIQKERMSAVEYNKAKEIYKITKENLSLLKPKSRLLHPLPHVEEIELPVETEQKDKKVAYFRQAQNGLYIRMALLSYLLE